MNYCWNRNHSIWLWFLSLLYSNLIFIQIKLGNGESSHKQNHTWITEGGSVLIRKGTPLILLCSVNLEYVKARDYRVYLTYMKYTGEQLDVTNVNETTIALYIPNAEEITVAYVCHMHTKKVKSPTPTEPRTISFDKKNNTVAFVDSYHLMKSFLPNITVNSKILVGSVRVVVGESPKVDEFSCISNNWEELICTWFKPIDRVITNYTLQYEPLNSTKPASECPNNIKTTPKCIWSAKTTPPYYHDVEDLKITLTVVNFFGKLEKSFYFNKFTHVKPKDPIVVSTSQISPTAIRLTWKLDPSDYFDKIPINWNYKIRLNEDYDSFEVICKPEQIMQINETFSYNVTGLTPKKRYRIPFYMKSPKAPQEDKYWSDSKDSSGYIIMKPLVGPILPETDTTLFELVDKGNQSQRVVTIFWRIPNQGSYENQCQYKIDLYRIDTAGNKALLKTDIHTDSYRDSSDTYTVDNSAHQFVLTPNPDPEGYVPSYINVPAAPDEAPLCTSFVVIARDYYNKTMTYECIWQPPKEPDIISYTLFWYWPQNDIYDWIRVPANVTKYHISLYEKYFRGENGCYTNWIDIHRDRRYCIRSPENQPQIYISVNTKNSSSGLLHYMQRLHSVSHMWETKWFGHKKSNSLQKPFQNESSERVTHNGWKFSPNQFQMWLGKVQGPEN